MQAIDAGEPLRGGRGVWRLIESGPSPGPWNLALDEAIFQAVRQGASPPTMRLYRWSAPALTIGYAQDRDRDVDCPACRARGIEVLRRITGGRAVLHAAEVTYSVSAPAGLPGFGPGLAEAYRHIAAGLLAGLRLLGLDSAAATAAPPRSPGQRRDPACFATASRHEVVVGGRKLIGSAQRRAGGAFLQQGSILLEAHGSLLTQLLHGFGGVAGEDRMTGLGELLDPAPAPDAVAAAVAAACASVWGVSFLPGEPSSAERLGAAALVEGRYRREEWNAGRRGGATTAQGRHHPCASPTSGEGFVDTGAVRSYHAEM
jgi:lipoate-protein ligase A